MYNNNPVQTAQKLEEIIRAYLFGVTRVIINGQTVPATASMFDVYTHAQTRAKESGIFITAQFFNRVVSDMKRAGIVELVKDSYNPGSSHASIRLSHGAYEQQKASGKAGV